MSKKLKQITLVFGAFIIILLSSIYGRTAIQSINGLAVASGTLWTNLKDAAFGDNATSGIMAINPYLFDGTNFDRARGDTTNGLDVDVTRVSGSVTMTGSVTPADASANPTTAVITDSRISTFNGATWDRALNSTHGDAITTTKGINTASIMYGWNGTNYTRIESHSTNSDAETATATANALEVAAHPYLFDGTTFSRLGGGVTNADAIATTTVGNQRSISYLLGFNGTTWDRLASGGNAADAEATRSLGVLEVDSYPRMFNGTTWDRMRGDTTNGLKVNCTIGCSGGSGSTTPADGFTNPTTAFLNSTLNSLFNGTTWDRARSAQITSASTGTTLGVSSSGLVGYDNTGSTVNTYKPVLEVGNLLQTAPNVTIGFNNITTNTDTFIASGTAGFLLHQINVNISGDNTARLVVRSEPDGATPCGGTIIATIDISINKVISYNLYQSNGFCFTTSGTTAANLTILYTTIAD